LLSRNTGSITTTGKRRNPFARIAETSCKRRRSLSDPASRIGLSGVDDTSYGTACGLKSGCPNFSTPNSLIIFWPSWEVTQPMYATMIP